VLCPYSQGGSENENECEDAGSDGVVNRASDDRNGGRSVPGGPIGTFKETFWQILADKVGVEKDELLEYVKEAARETMRGAIDRGLVPEGLGNQLLRALDARSTRLFPFVRPKSAPWRRRLPPRTCICLPFQARPYVLDGLAGASEISEEEVRAAIKEGRLI